jgi:hypothetical protein
MCSSITLSPSKLRFPCCQSLVCHIASLVRLYLNPYKFKSVLFTYYLSIPEFPVWHMYTGNWQQGKRSLEGESVMNEHMAIPKLVGQGLPMHVDLTTMSGNTRALTTSVCSSASAKKVLMMWKCTCIGIIVNTTLQAKFGVVVHHT